MRGDFGDDEWPYKTGVLIDYMDTPLGQEPVIARMYGLWEGALATPYVEARALELANRGVELIQLIDISGRCGVALPEDIPLTPEAIALFHRAGFTYLRRLRSRH